MYDLKIVKEISEESVEHLFPNEDDFEELLDAVDNDMIDYLPFWMLDILAKNGFIEIVKE